MGRYPKLDEKWTAEAAKKQIDMYFADARERNKRPTMSGIAYHLDCTRRILDIYLQEDHSDSPLHSILTKAIAFIDMTAEEDLRDPEMRNVTGPLFYLKNRGWKDSQDINSNVTVNDARGLFDACQTSNLFSHSKESAVIKKNDGRESQGDKENLN